MNNPTAALPLPGVANAALHGGHGVRRYTWDSRFHRQHLWVPLVVFAMVSVVLIGLHADLWLADAIYSWEGHAWRLQSGHFTQDVLHAEGRRAAQLVWSGVLLLWVLSWPHRPWAQWRRPLAYLLLSVLLATALVGVMKRWTHVDCPWDLLRYGGGKAYYGLFTRRPPGMGSAGCFPAGHASAGYAWVALYFFFLHTRPRLRWWGLAAGLVAGLVFGIAQQLRGAHFLSHDVWALMICWLVALALYHGMLVWHVPTTQGSAVA